MSFLTERMSIAMEDADRAAFNLSVINSVAQSLASNLETLDSTSIIELVGNRIFEMLQPGHLSIWLPDENDIYGSLSPRLSAVRAWGAAAEVVQQMHLEIPIAVAPTYNDLLLRCYLESQKMVEMQPGVGPSIQGVWYQPGMGVFVLPLLVKDQARGVLLLQDTVPLDRFSIERQGLLVAIASQMTIALENVRLYRKIQRFNSDLEQLVQQRTSELATEKERLQTLHDISAEINSTLELDRLLYTSLEALAKITRVRYGTIMLMDKETEHLVNEAVLGFSADEVDTFTRFAIGYGVAGWIAQYKRPVIVDDVQQDERWIEIPDNDPARKHAGSLVAVPLVAHQEVLGVVILSHEEVNYFHDDHLRLLTASAGPIAMGIHNARLYTEIVTQMEVRSTLVQRLRESETRDTAILQSLADGVLVGDINGRVLSVNPPGADMLGSTREELLLLDLQTILNHVLGKREEELPLNELLSHPTNKDNTPRRFETTVNIGMRVVNMRLGPVLLEDNEMIGVILNLRDMTREVQSDRLKTEFIGTMSHELRTPMTAIKGFTQLLVMGSLGPLNDTQREFMTTIQTNAQRMIDIINDVLELTKIETGSIDLEIRPLHLAEALSGVVSDLQQLADEREHNLTISIPPGLPLVQADANRLYEVLYNLIANAIKYTPRGGSVWVEAHEADADDLPSSVRNYLLSNRRYTQIDVRDTGVGIAPEEIDRVFERFYRTDNPLKVEAGGTGLGLSLTKPLIEIMGGYIWVESELHAGTTFSFILPAAQNVKTS
ncbi:MAG: GAF domain-containing protein [Chloroflexaceae bacterium]|nr:GAF domain-containing protein [Chloroflexaceae bacterium]